MIRIITFIALYFMLSQPFGYAKELKADLLLTEQLNGWCMSEKPMAQQFCQAYLFGVYETTDCKFKIQTPDFNELKTTFVTWVFVKGGDGFIYAVIAALAAYEEKYDCK